MDFDLEDGLDGCLGCFGCLGCLAALPLLVGRIYRDAVSTWTGAVIVCLALIILAIWALRWCEVM